MARQVEVLTGPDEVLAAGAGAAIDFRRSRRFHRPAQEPRRDPVAAGRAACAGPADDRQPGGLPADRLRTAAADGDHHLPRWNLPAEPVGLTQSGSLLLDGERDYQDQRRSGHHHSVTEYLVYLRDYVEEALHLVSRSDGEDGAKPIVRKIAALAVACMEQNGAPTR